MESSSVSASERYARQIVFSGIGKDGQEKLLKARVALAGCGADGTLIADRLVRAGVGHLTIIDRDVVELSNLQRQFLYDEDDVRSGLPKAVAAERKLRAINSQVDITGLVADLNAENAEALLSGADLVMDGTDNPITRYIINDVCVKHDVPWVYCGVGGSSGTVMTIVPHQTPCLRCLIPDPPSSGSAYTGEIVGLINAIVPVMAGIAVSEGLKLLVGGGQRLEGGFRLELWENLIETSDASAPRPGCPTCGRGAYEFLEETSGAPATSLCGRRAVQIRWPGAGHVPLADVVKRLSAAGQVTACNDYLLRFRVDEVEITLFADARAIIKGTGDERLARSLYAKYMDA